MMFKKTIIDVFKTIKDGCLKAVKWLITLFKVYEAVYKAIKNASSWVKGLIPANTISFTSLPNSFSEEKDSFEKNIKDTKNTFTQSKKVFQNLNEYLKSTTEEELMVFVTCSVYFGIVSAYCILTFGYDALILVQHYFPGKFGAFIVIVLAWRMIIYTSYFLVHVCIVLIALMKLECRKWWTVICKKVRIKHEIK